MDRRTFLTTATVGGIMLATGQSFAAAPIYETDFSRSLGDKWVTWNAPRVLSSNAEVSNGALHLHFRPGTDGIYQGAAVKLNISRTYGAYEVKAAVTKRGTGSHINLMLWPTDDATLTEVNFAEMGPNSVPNWDEVHQTVHMPTDQQIHTSYRTDLTEPHTYGASWRKGTVTYTKDGKAIRKVSNSHVPSTPMALHLRCVDQPGGGGNTKGGPTTLTIYKVRVWG